MKFYPGFDIEPLTNPMSFKYGSDVFGPDVENRTLDSIRKSLRNPKCDGPNPVYSIAMDVGKKKHFRQLKQLHLLYGVVIYAAGRLGDEPVRSQGHIHKVSPLSGWSTPEVYEIWSGKAIIYMQETARDDPGRCYAIEAHPGDIVVVPPYWAHSTISSDPKLPLIFGAWCDRSYGFDYKDIRMHGGLAWFPIIENNGEIKWQRNLNYKPCKLQIKKSADYSLLNIKKHTPIYKQFEEDNSRFLFVSKPALKERIWSNFIP